MKRSNYSELYDLQMMPKEAGFISDSVAKGITGAGKGVGKAVWGGIKGIATGSAGKVIAPLAVGGAAIYGGAKVLKAVKNGSRQSQLENPTPNTNGG